jgi:hypothetical protein
MPYSHHLPQTTGGEWGTKPGGLSTAVGPGCTRDPGILGTRVCLGGRVYPRPVWELGPNTLVASPGYTRIPSIPVNRTPIEASTHRLADEAQGSGRLRKRLTNGSGRSGRRDGSGRPGRQDGWVGRAAGRVVASRATIRRSVGRRDGWWQVGQQSGGRRAGRTPIERPADGVGQAG